MAIPQKIITFNYPHSAGRHQYSVVHAIGFIKGKSAIHLARNYLRYRRDFTDQFFLVRGGHNSIVSRDEKPVSEFIRFQEKNRYLEELSFFKLGCITWRRFKQINALSGLFIQDSGFADELDLSLTLWNRS